MLAAKQWSQSDFVLYPYSYPQNWLGQFSKGTWYAWVNTKDGVIIVTAAYAPKPPLVNPDQPDDPVPATHLSDFIFLVLKEQCGIESLACIQRLKYVIRHKVVNQISQQIANQVLLGKPNEPPNYRYPAWSKQSYAATTDNGAALIGVPNGYGVAYSLMQHVLPLGRWTIKKVRVFGNDNGELCLAYRVMKCSQCNVMK
ncbi:hypothetical protein MMC10_000331 [Thelotrema lepadinum]|nr:hypothetical protein [Thelotrema lepadinum]